MINIFIGSLSTKKNSNGGERQKSTLMYEELAKIDSHIVCINLERHRLFSLLRFFLFCIFKKKKINSIIISKFAKGGILIHRLLWFFRVRNTKVYYFLVGSKLADFLNKRTIKYIENDTKIVVESNSIKEPIQKDFPLLNIDVLPNFKRISQPKLSEKKYPKRELHAVFFSRLLIDKGIIDAIDALKIFNNDSIKIRLDIYGPESENRRERAKVSRYIFENSYFCTYKGNINSSYVSINHVLEKYDFHIFPTKFPEGIPGTLIDCLSSGLPTLSSSFPRCMDVLDETDSFIYEQFNMFDLQNKINYIYTHQNELIKKRYLSYKKAKKFSSEIFVDYIKRNEVFNV